MRKGKGSPNPPFSDAHPSNFFWRENSKLDPHHLFHRGLRVIGVDGRHDAAHQRPTLWKRFIDQHFVRGSQQLQHPSHGKKLNVETQKFIKRTPKGDLMLRSKGTKTRKRSSGRTRLPRGGPCLQQCLPERQLQPLWS